MNKYTAYTTFPVKLEITDAVERITKFRRMCESHDFCPICPLREINRHDSIQCNQLLLKYPQETLTFVDKFGGF